MTRWVRFDDNGTAAFGTVEDNVVHVHEGDMFDGATDTGRTLSADGLKLLPPCQPTKVIALWNNFRALGAKLGVSAPEDPLYLLKAVSSITSPQADVPRPKAYDGRIVYEGELGIVIGKRLANASVTEAEDGIFGYTCVNDITAGDLLNKDPNFPQWARAKSFDGFCPFGPVIATGLDPSTLSIRTVLNGAERQNYPVSDMIFPAADLVSRISQDMTLMPGDLIACGTSVGVGSMKEPVNIVEVSIEGIGTLSNRVLC
ncbi:Homoprotocatechuate catabolism bifunctional isomerase/decarboxylase [Hartmannibacter diazotrophicus]|uniref:Homoprotocatechuate catabolism bifunctional isomerase/decarboxylase n=1 Tax=Hartmannibacter diazotrophicus TaxID=1482074 RepID=A0A2C9DBZ7_9HYPH|nr:fumarylacetoacetate hydrolase family protein [Hartmannibacter diazotrophicus]SON57699.1 Homoprotocatechuate catabolism bifunctional isomerase/decarboxylase [Hartmannibacter diazotrophicus]